MAEQTFLEKTLNQRYEEAARKQVAAMAKIAEGTRERDEAIIEIDQTKADLDWYYAALKETRQERVKPNAMADTSGTSLQGYVAVSYNKIVEVFGEPNDDGDGYKIDARWILTTPDGVATVYNYKDGINYNGEDGTPVEDITDWHIGGHSDAVVVHVQRALGAVETE